MRWRARVRRSVQVVDRSHELLAERWERLVVPVDVVAEHADPVLVVEDDEATRSAFVEVLELGGYDVTAAADGREALRLASAIEPATIVVDLNLPELDGDAFVREWRKVVSEAAHDPAIIVVSARPDAYDAASALGAQACLQKPFDGEELLAVVDDAMAATSAR